MEEESVKQITKISLLMGLLCFILSALIAIQIRSIRGTTSIVGESQTTNQLRDSVLEWREKYEQALDKLEYKEAELEKIRKKISSENQGATDITTAIADNNQALGMTEVNGQGITIVCKDGEISSSSILTSQYLVHDGDLLNLINALKNAGAEAISINEQRIVNKTSIYCSGNIIMVNNERVGSPFVIKAIGNPEGLYGAIIMPGSYYSKMKEDGVQVSITKENSLVIPKYNGTYKYEYATIIE